MTLGAGVFTIPMVYNALGYVHASLWVVAMGIFADIAMERLLDISVQHSKDCYNALSELAFGAAGKTMMSAITLVTTFIAGLSYICTAKELLLDVTVAFLLDVDPNAHGEVEILSKGKTIVLLTIMVCAALPLTLSPTMGDNAWISKFGVCAMIISSIFFIIRCAMIWAQGCTGEMGCGEKPPAFKGSVGDVMMYAATLAFSFSIVFALFPVLQERVTAEGSVEAAVPPVRRAVRRSVAVCCVLYLLIGLVGSFAFGSAVNSIALCSLPLKEPLTQLVMLLVGVSVWMLTAIVAFPAVSSAEYLVKMCMGSSYRSGIRMWLVIVIGAAMVLVDAFVPTKIAFTLCGALGLSMGAYVVPCVLFLRLNSSGRTAKLLRVATLVVLVFGLTLLFGSTPVTVVNALGEKGGAAARKLMDLLCGHLSADPTLNFEL
mmetsp:Transcript_66960/g.217910  ORF Transcript_66960/g.217910 Transcript_66960/m.217910 type:complete len:431 (+) Transcript_66960:104-1396(+)